MVVLDRPAPARPVKPKTPHGALLAAAAGLLLAAAGCDEGGGDTLDVSGRWQTNYGVVTLTQTGSHITGAYAGGEGGVTGELNGNQVTGYWQRSGPTVLCPEARE